MACFVSFVAAACVLLLWWCCWPHCLSRFLIEIFHLVAPMLHRHHPRVRAGLAWAEQTTGLPRQRREEMAVL
jgi:hypothetical protein